MGEQGELNKYVTNMNKEIFINGVETGIANRFKAQVLQNGRVVRETPWASNLILENGMNRIAVDYVCNLFLYCAIGSGDTPTEDSSGSITATTSGTTVTSSDSLFTSDDVGKLLRFNTGEKSIITAFTDNTTVTVADSLGVSSATEFTMYRIAQTGLDSEVARTNNYLTGSGNCGTTLSVDTYTHRRTFDFPAEVEDQSYSEVGFSHSSSSGANLNTRGIFAGAPVSVVTGQQLRVIYEFKVKVSPISPRDREVSISGWPAKQYSVAVSASTDLVTLVGHGFAAGTKIKFDGDTAPEGISFGTAYYVLSNTADTFKLSATEGGSAIDITSDGSNVVLYTNTKGQEQLTSGSVSQVSSANGGTVFFTDGGSSYCTDDPYSSAKYCYISTSSSNLPSFGTGFQDNTAPTGGRKVMSKDSYTASSYIVTWRTTFGTGEGNSTAIRKLAVGSGIQTGGNYTVNGLCYRFDQPQEKSNLYTLTVVWKFSWDRDFI